VGQTEGKVDEKEKTSKKGKNKKNSGVTNDQIGYIIERPKGREGKKGGGQGRHGRYMQQSSGK